MSVSIQSMQASLIFGAPHHRKIFDIDMFFEVDVESLSRGRDLCSAPDEVYFKEHKWPKAA